MWWKTLILDCNWLFKCQWKVIQTFFHELLRFIYSHLHWSCNIYMDIRGHFLYTHMDTTFYPYEHYCFFAWTMLGIYQLINLPCHLYYVDQCTLVRLDLEEDVQILNILYITLTFLLLQIQMQIQILLY